MYIKDLIEIATYGPTATKYLPSILFHNIADSADAKLD